MSLKQELETWAAALAAYDAQDFDGCLRQFDNIEDKTSKILFNIAIVQATTGHHERAVRNFDLAIQLDEFLAVAYFQAGVSNFLLGRYAVARRDFHNAYLYLRDNSTIDYEQLGLKFQLYSCEVLFNRGLSSLYLGQEAHGIADLMSAAKEKQTEVHSVIDEALQESGKGYTVFSIPVGVLYRPSANKMKNLKTRDYLGTAKLIAATDERDAFTGFTGTSRIPPTASPQALVRSNTSAPRMQSDFKDGVASPLRRRPSNIKSLSPSSSRGPPPPTKGLVRAMTTINVSPRSPHMPPPTPPSSGEMERKYAVGNQRQSYSHDLIESYYVNDHPQPPTPSGQPVERVRDWARETHRDPPQQQDLPLSRSVSHSTVASSSLDRSNSRGLAMTAVQRPPISTVHRTSDEHNSCVTGSHSGTLNGEREMVKIRIKLRYLDDVRGMSIAPDLRHEDFVEKVRIKFGRASDMRMKYKDAEAVLISIVDTGDWECAIDEARDAARGRSEGKLEIYLAD